MQIKEKLEGYIEPILTLFLLIDFKKIIIIFCNNARLDRYLHVYLNIKVINNI
jgi:hypothetical protein